MKKLALMTVLIMGGALSQGATVPPYPYSPFPWGIYKFPRYPDIYEGDRARLQPYGDADIRENVEDQFFQDPFLNAFDVDIQVRNGVVTLTGRVDNREDKRRAEMNAFEAGATSVINRLIVSQ